MNLKSALLSLAAFSAALSGCRLYEPPRYARLNLPPGTPQTRVLMIGDSLTYYNDLPGLLQQFSAAEPAPIAIEQVTTPYASLKFHWEMGKAAERIRDGHFDYIILQDFSRKPVTDPGDSLKYFSLFDTAAKKVGTKTIVFENWTRRGLEKEFDPLRATYYRIENQTGAIPAPIGTAWKDFAAAYPDVPLLLDDRHPTDAGSYLAASVLYASIYHKKSADLPAGFSHPKLPESLMKTIRHSADQSTAEITRRPLPL